MTVEKNIMFPMELQKIPKKVQKETVKKLLENVQLEGFEKRKMREMSGGQMQRVAIARALAAKPAILLADEPTGNLDSKTSQDVLGLLKVTSKRFHQTIVMITHNEEIAQMADRILQIEDGKIVSDSGLV
jgi:putative ABC transport system ATP-binding protein